ncbi:MAG: Gfo/Idh/MocA family protein, partial [bacterium]
ALARCAREHADVLLAACCDTDAARAALYSHQFGFARSYTDALAMLEAERPDAAVLVVPPEATAALAGRVLARGIPVLIEKPPGRSLAELDLLIAAAGKVPHQVAFNRRFVPLVQEARRRLASLEPGSALQHIRYEMTRVGRRDADFSTTAIHGLDAVRFLAGSDYASAQLRYQELPGAGPGVCNIFVEAQMASGATAHLAFCPMAGVVVERATMHAGAHSLFLHIPMWGAFDSPGRLQHLEGGRVRADIAGDPAAESFVLGGFYGECEAFLGDLRALRAPSPSLPDSRQSMELADCIRERRKAYPA